MLCWVMLHQTWISETNLLGQGWQMWHLSCNREVWGLTAWELTFYFIIVWYVCYAIEETRVKADILLSHRDIARRMSVSLLFLLLRNSNTHNLTIIKCFRTSLLFPLRILVFLRYLIQWEGRIFWINVGLPSNRLANSYFTFVFVLTAHFEGEAQSICDFDTKSHFPVK